MLEPPFAAAGQLVTEQEAAEILAVSPVTLRNWRSLRIGPRYRKIGSRAVRYHRADLAAFIEGTEAEWEAP